MLSVTPLRDFGAPLESIVNLHRTNSKSLGFFPRGAFDEYAARGQILVVQNGQAIVLGYLLYRIARSRAIIVHLCVAQGARGKGIAKLLVQELKEKTRALEGIGLYCRRDLHAHRLWPRFSFEAASKKTGRGKDAAELVFWWFTHGHADLFTPKNEEESSRRAVVIDANVFFDIHFRECVDSMDSKALLAGWLQDSIELVITKELRNEIARGNDSQKRDASRLQSQSYRTLSSDDGTFTSLCSELRSIFPNPPNQQDEADLRQIAYAIAGGVSFFVSRDMALLERCESLYARYGLMVRHPAELINHLDSVERELDYRPARLHGSQLRSGRLQTDEVDTVVRALKGPNERGNQFRRTLLHVLSNPKAAETQVVMSNRTAPILLGVLDRSNGES